MPEVHFYESDILTRLQKLNINKSPGPDLLHPRVLFEARNEIVQPLRMIFECSFSTTQLPTDWKSANISAIFKKGSKCDAANYRPISLTSVVCKIFESIIRDTVNSHFSQNNLFSNRQFGFIKGRSTVLQLLRTLDQWTEQLEIGGQIDAIYTDLEKAFDKVPHRRLISKL
jgi:hypothetical protein